MEVLAVTVDGRWHAGIGDPTIVGWFTALGYVLSALICASAARSAAHPQLDRSRPGRAFWWSLALIMLLLGINKQLDIQTLFGQIGRDMAKSEGWYAYRRVVQAGFVAAIAIGGGVVGLTLAWRLRKTLRHTAVVLAGLIFLLCFICIRAASFHHIDTLLGVSLGFMSVNNVLELSGVGLVGVGAAWGSNARA